MHHTTMTIDADTTSPTPDTDTQPAPEPIPDNTPTIDPPIIDHTIIDHATIDPTSNPNYEVNQDYIDRAEREHAEALTLTREQINDICLQQVYDLCQSWSHWYEPHELELRCISDNLQRFHFFKIPKSRHFSQAFAERLRTLRFGSQFKLHISPDVLAELQTLGEEQLNQIAQYAAPLYNQPSRWLKGRRIVNLTDALIHIAKQTKESKSINKNLTNYQQKLKTSAFKTAYREWMQQCVELKKQAEEKRKELIAKQTHLEQQLQYIKLEIKSLYTPPPAPQKSDYEI